MLKADTRISIADLAAVGITLKPMDAVAIVRELVLQVSRGVIPGVPSLHVIRITPAGALVVEGPVAAGSRSISRAAQLLEALLPPFDASVDIRVPGALRLALARAMGTLDLPPYQSLEAFAEVLHRFAPTDNAKTMRDLVLRWAQAAEIAAGPDDSSRDEIPDSFVPGDPVPVTISDIRRARRATGLPLAEVAERSRVPVELLRQLEWGYLRNWPLGLYGRTQLVRYARASGLDEQLVIETVSPLLETAAEQASAAPLPPEASPLEVTVAAEPDPVTVEPIAEPASAPPVAPEQDVPQSAEASMRLGLEDFPAESESESTVVPQPQGQPPVSAPLDVVVAQHALLWEPESAALPRLVRRSQPRRRGLRVAGWLGAAAVVGLAVTPFVTDQLQRDRQEQLTALRSTVDRLAASIPPIRRTTLLPAELPTTTATEEAIAPAAAPPPAAAEPPRAPVEDAVALSSSLATTGSAAFYRSAGDRDGALMPADDRGEGSVLRITRVVDDHAKNYHARPSPDGERIAFDSDRDGERGVYIANVDGTNVRRVSGPGYAAVPSWSPDGGRLVFVRAEQDDPKIWNLWTVELESGELHRLTSNTAGQPWGASWFPDGRQIAYSLDDRLIVHDIESGRDKVFTSPRKGQVMRTPAVSPDGRRVIFQIHRDGAWLLDLQDGSMRKVLADPTAEEYAWSPDGRRVAYHSRRSGQWGVWLMASR
jgi:hypothetical protein